MAWVGCSFYPIRIRVPYALVVRPYKKLQKERRKSVPVFYILVLLACIVLWFLLSYLYQPIGKLVHRIWKDAKDSMTEKEKE